MSEWITCVSERELPSFHGGALALSLRLSIASDETSKLGALARMRRVFELLPTLRYAIYGGTPGGTWSLIDGDAQIEREFERAAADRLWAWLAEFEEAAFTHPWIAPTGTKQPAKPADELHAHDILLAFAGRIAPAPQECGVALIVRTNQQPTASGDWVVVVPYPAGTEINLVEPSQGLTNGALWGNRYVSPVTSAEPDPFDLVGVRATPTKPLPPTQTAATGTPATTKMMVDDEGFITPDHESSEAHGAFARFETMAGGLLSSSVLPRSLDWTVVEDTEDSSAPPPARQKAIRQIMLRRFAWTAMTTVSGALDTLLLAIAMPTAEAREGALLADFSRSFVEALRAIVEKTGNEPSLPQDWRATIRTAIRNPLAAMAITTTQASLPAAPFRDTLVDELSAIAGLASMQQSDIALLLKILDTYRRLDDLVAWEDLEAYATTLVTAARTAAATSDLRDDATILQQMLSANLAQVEERLTGDAGIAAATRQILDRIAAASLPQLVAGFAGYATQEQLNAAWVEACDATAALLDRNGNGMQAARAAAGSLFADRLQADLSGQPLTRDALRKVLEFWGFWRARLLKDATATLGDITGQLADPIGDLQQFFTPSTAGAGVPPLPDDANAVAEIELAVAAAEAEAITALLPERLRFVPNTYPPPLAIRCLVDAHTDDDGGEDDFASAFSGVALLLNRSDTPNRPHGWSYANLAAIAYADDPAVIIHPVAIEPIPVSANDGRREVFVPYDGKPHSFKRPTAGPGAGARPLIRTTYPATPACGAVAPALAYGCEIAMCACAVGRAGSLPMALQGTRPWLPKADPLIDARLFETYPVSRTTRIGTVAIGERSADTRIGRVPDGVRPLALDYARIALSTQQGAREVMDVHRGRDGEGLLGVADSGETRVTFQEIWAWSGDVALEVQIACDPDCSFNQGSPKLTAPLAAGACHTVTLVLKRQNGTLRMALEVDGKLGKSIASTLNHAQMVWVRLALANPGALSLRDPSSNATDADRQGNLLIVGAADGTWREALSTAARSEISYPRVILGDFERAAANPALRREIFGNKPTEIARGDAFLDLLMAADLERSPQHPELALLDALPDPMVSHLALEFALLDTLTEKLDTVSMNGTSGAKTHPLKLPTLGAMLAGMRDVDQLLRQGRLITVLRDIDRQCRLPLNVQARVDDSSLLELDAVASGITLNLAPGVVAAFQARPVLPARYFERGAGCAPIVVEQMLQLAEGTLTVDGVQHVVFAGATLKIESMLGAIAVNKPEKPWHSTRAQWSDLAEAEVTHEPKGKARSYDLSITLGDSPGAPHWRARQIGWIETQTQRWRFGGKPIYHWAAPRGAARPAIAGQASLDIDPKTYVTEDRSGSISLVPSEWTRFEDQAFEGRDDQDFDLDDIMMQPEGRRTRLVEIEWDKPSATVYRHRFRLRSRYFGAFRNAANAAVLATLPPADANFQRRRWRRIAVLADRSRLALPRPQLRAITPLTRAAGGAALEAPPLLAILQERPFAYAGLADRIAARIDTALRYRQVGDTIAVDSVAAEIGAAPGGPPIALAEAVSQQLVIAAEGPVGLTFDRLTTSAPAFANCGYLLPLLQIDNRGDLRPAPIDYENFLTKVSLQRYLDPDWLINQDGDATPSASFDFNHAQWIDLIPGARLQFQCKALALDNATYAETDTPTASDIDTDTDNDIVSSNATRVSWLKYRQTDHRITIHIARRSVDPSIKDCDSDRWLELVGLAIEEGSSASLSLLHVPLDARRASLAVFLNRPGRLPVLLRSIEHVVLDFCGAEEIFVSHASARPTEASTGTPSQWARISRNFEATHGVVPGSPGLTNPVAISRIEAHRSKTSKRVMLKTKDKQGQRVTIWPRGKSERPASAGHYQSHVAMLFSRSVETLGTPIELPNEIVMLTGYGARVDEGTGADVVRLLEFEIPAVVCGHGTTDKLPAIYGNPRFDLTAIGFDRARVAATSPGDPTVLLSLCIRLYGDQAARGALNRLALSLQSDAAADGEFITGADPYETIVIEVDLPKADMFVPAEIMLDLEVTEDGIARVARQCCVGDSGEARQVSPVSTKAKLFASAKSAPGVRVQGISVQSMLPSFTSGNHQIYAEIGMIASEPGCGFQGALDFNWFFGEGEASLEDLLHDLRITASLQKMVEAQAVLVRFSPAIPITPVD